MKEQTVSLHPTAARVLILRTSGRYMQGFGGFPWPWRGAVYAPESWDTAWGEQPENWVGGFRPKAKQGGGLHGFENGEGEWGLLSWDSQARAIIIETDETLVARSPGQIRFSAGNVIDVTSLPTALCRLICNPERIHMRIAAAHQMGGTVRVMRSSLATSDRDANLASTASLCQLAAAGKGSRLSASAVNCQLATAGSHSVLATTGERCQLASSGSRSLLTAAGRRSKIAVSGDHTKLAASSDECRLATSGDFSRAVSSGAACHLAASGVHNMLASSGPDAALAGSGTCNHLVASGQGSRLAATGRDATLDAAGKDSICMTAGTNSRAKAGPNGAIAIAWHDGRRPRIAVGYVGEDGIKEDTWYKVKDGRLTEQEEWSPYCDKD